MRRRLRQGLAVGFFVGLALGGLAILVLSFRGDEAGDRAQRASIALAGVSARLTERYGLEFESLAAGRELASGRYDFRGALTGELRRSAPIYGVAELTCRALSRDPGCWRIVSLERDGEPWNPVEPEKVGGVAASGAESRAGDTAPSSAETAARAPAETVQPESATPREAEISSEPDLTSGGPAEGVSADEAAESAPVEAVEENAPNALYIVTAPAVNGRAGPGTGHAIVAKVTPEMRLELRERQDDWGRFQIAGAAESEAEQLWIWMPLVRPLSEGPEA